jgi:hypothetical protein
MDHWVTTEEIKDASRKRRRLANTEMIAHCHRCRRLLPREPIAECQFCHALNYNW